jgi:UDP-N-acetylglucosamine acyltransferase
MSARMIDPSARVEAGAEIGSNVTIGPYCTVGANVVIGDDCRLVAHVNLSGHTTIGPRTVIYPFASLGTPPQHVGYRGEPTRLVVGADCDIREGVTMNIGTAQHRGITTVGDKCFAMAGSHVAHDCDVGRNVVLANNVMLAGHVSVGDNVVFGGGAAVRQFTRIGEGAMVTGLSGVRADVIPWGMAHGRVANLVGLNVVGMRRGGASKAEILNLRRAYRALFFGDGEFGGRLDGVEREFGDDARVRRIVEFIRTARKANRPVTMAIDRGEVDEEP